MRISETGNLGINSVSPSYQLDVTGDINSSTALRVGGTQVCTSSGCTPSSAGALSGITAALASHTIDNTLFDQVWNWTTATTQTLMTMAANALTTGSMLSLTTSNGTLNSTNGLLYVANTGASTSGTIARIQANSTAGSGLTVMASGNVGIGTTTPNSGSLSIYSAGKLPNDSGINIQTASDNNASLNLVNSGITWQFSTRTAAENYAFGFFSNRFGWKAPITFKQNGNMFIGGTSASLTMPVSMLDVNGGVSVGTYAGVSAAPSNGMIVSGNVGIGTTSPSNTLQVIGSMCVKDTVGNCAGSTAGTIYATSTTVSAADYAEYFAAQEFMMPGDIVGLDTNSGKVRRYQAGDHLMGIVSRKPGMIGNGEADKNTSALVGLMGQLPFNASQAKVKNGTVYTLDGVKIGPYLSNGEVYINISSAHDRRSEGGASIQSLVLENKGLRLENELIKARLEKIEKLIGVK